MEIRTNLVSLDPDVVCCGPDVVVMYPKNDRERDDDVDDVVKQHTEREKGTPSKKNPLSFSVGQKDEKGTSTTSRCQTIAKDGYNTNNATNIKGLEDSDSSIQQDLNRAAVADKERAEHFRTPGKPDLTGMSFKQIIALGLKHPDTKARGKVRIIAKDGYRTQNPLPDNPSKFIDHLYVFGEIVEFEHWRSLSLIKRGIAEPVEAST